MWEVMRSRSSCRHWSSTVRGSAEESSKGTTSRRERKGVQLPSNGEHCISAGFSFIALISASVRPSQGSVPCERKMRM